jgi:Fe-S cluster assembly scaffold protein SufB
MVIEKGIKAKANVVCSALKMNLSGVHKARGKLILKEGASLSYNHVHKWGEKDNVFPDYEFILENNSSLEYNYLNMLPPEKLEIKNKIICGEKSSSNLNISVNGINSKIRIKEEVVLKGKDAQAVSRLKMVGRKKSDIVAESSIVAKERGRGHIDCQSLMIDKDSRISSIPLLVCENKDAQITHEASIGKVSEEQLNYLRARGLNEKQAVDLIVSGFLKA